MYSKLSAVLTGDIINSSKAEPVLLNKAMEQLHGATTDIIHKTDQPDMRFTRFRGDGWQVYLDDPRRALRATLIFVAVLRAGRTGLSSRIAIGTGTINNLGTFSLSDANGSAFEKSGWALDAMKQQDRVSFDGDGLSVEDEIIAELLVERAGRWSIAQAEAMTRYLHPEPTTLEIIAESLGITPQAVNYRIVGAGGGTIRKSLQKWEDAATLKFLMVLP